NRPLIYFDSAASAQKPQCVIDEIGNYYELYTSNIHRGAHRLSEIATAKYHDARAYVAKFLQIADAGQVVFTRNTTEAINLVTHCLGKIYFKAGDEIILTAMEHHANIVPWYLLSKEKNLTIKVAPIFDDGSLDLEGLMALFNEKTKFFAVAHASNVLGTINPIKKLVALARSYGVPTLIDGAQGVHHVPLDLKAVDPDFYCFSGHKAYGPSGIGVLYGKSTWLDRFPPYQGGGDMIEKVSFSDITFLEAPRKFEAGTPNIEGALGLKKALEYIDGIGLHKIHEYEKSLHDYALGHLHEMKRVRIVGSAEEKVSLLSFVIDGVHPHDVSTIFDRHGIAIRAGHLCAEPLMARLGVTALSRASLAFYNTYEEIDRFVSTFKQVFEVFKL
ncbi:MAG TPA: cysteine desulfurase, partial [Myxococcota bacterium]|nr:cysteine desulfurase [Myxococcota bacterium]